MFRTMRQFIAVAICALAVLRVCTSTSNQPQRTKRTGNNNKRSSFWKSGSDASASDTTSDNVPPRPRPSRTNQGNLSRMFTKTRGFLPVRGTKRTEWTTLERSKHAQNTTNPIRAMCSAECKRPNPNKSIIRLSLGDPTIMGNLPPSPVVIQSMQEIVSSIQYNGYGDSTGILSARQAIVKHFSTPKAPFTEDDVMLASGCAHALQLIIEAIGNEGENILIPSPGFPLYKTHANAMGIKTRNYALDMEKGEVNLMHLEAQISPNTRAIIVNNPSNPTGSVYSKKHLIDILAIAEKHKLVVIADEIYGDLVYGGAQFFPMAELNPNVPMVVVDGIAKRYLVPGWRLGWMIFHNRHGVLTDIKKGVLALTQKIVGPCMLVQGVLPLMLDRTPKEHFENTRKLLSANADMMYNKFKNVPGMRPLKPQGAMYMIMGIDKSMYGDEKEFLQQLIYEESVYCPPGEAFGLKNWFRILLTLPPDQMEEAAQRIIEFASRRRASYRAKLLSMNWRGNDEEEEDPLCLTRTLSLNEYGD